MPEVFPSPENRVLVSSSGRITVQWTPTNRRAHYRLISAARTMMKRGGYAIVRTQTMGIETNSHQCGTVRFGKDPHSSVLDPFCRTHDVQNLYVVDGSFF